MKITKPNRKNTKEIMKKVESMRTDIVPHIKKNFSSTNFIAKMRRQFA